jgi:hypothetical protein
VCSQHQLGLGAPDSVRCARLVRSELAALGTRRRRRLKFTRPSGGAPGCPVSRLWRTRRSRKNGKGDVAIIHRTVRWCTGLFGEPTVASANGRPRNPQATRGSSNGRKEAPDCPVHQRAQSCNSRLCPIWKAIAHRIGYSSCPWRTGLSGAPLDRRQVWPSKLGSNGS